MNSGRGARLQAAPPDAADAAAWARRCAQLEALADARAAALGFLPNKAALALPFNRAGLPGSEDAFSLGGGKAETKGGMVTSASHARLVAEARALAAAAPPTPEQVRALRLINGPARSSAPNLEQLKLDKSYWKENDKLIAALELAAPPDEPVDPAELGTALIAYQPSLSLTLRNKNIAPEFSGGPVDRFLGLSVLFKAILIDRTNTLSCGLKLKILEPVPPMDPNFNLSLEEVICGRCRDLMKRYDRLHILWSGGIDTTAVVVGFLKTATPEDWATKLSVHYCPRSKDEHPRFFERFVAPLPRHGEIRGHVKDFAGGSRVAVRASSFQLRGAW